MEDRGGRARYPSSSVHLVDGFFSLSMCLVILELSFEGMGIEVLELPVRSLLIFMAKSSELSILKLVENTSESNPWFLADNMVNASIGSCRISSSQSKTGSSEVGLTGVDSSGIGGPYVWGSPKRGPKWSRKGRR